MKTIAAAKFKEQCLALLDAVGPEGLVVTKRGRPVARLVAVPRDPRALLGCLRGRIAISGDVFSTGVRWDADAQP